MGRRGAGEENPILDIPDKKMSFPPLQFTYLDLRRGPTYPVWVREQGFVRDPDAPLYTGVELVFPGAGGDYHTTYWPQAAFLSSRRYYFELATPVYSELRLRPRGEEERGGHEVYWHLNPVQGEECGEDCRIRWGKLIQI